MSIRLIVWTVVMACIGFLVAGRGSYLPLNVTLSGALMGAAFGFILGVMFFRRAKRKREPKSSLRRY